MVLPTGQLSAADQERDDDLLVRRTLAWDRLQVAWFSSFWRSIGSRTADPRLTRRLKLVTMPPPTGEKLVSCIGVFWL